MGRLSSGKWVVYLATFLLAGVFAVGVLSREDNPIHAGSLPVDNAASYAQDILENHTDEISFTGEVVNVSQSTIETSENEEPIPCMELTVKSEDGEIVTQQITFDETENSPSVQPGDPVTVDCVRGRDGRWTATRIVSPEAAHRSGEHKPHKPIYKLEDHAERGQGSRHGQRENGAEHSPQQ